MDIGLRNQNQINLRGLFTPIGIVEVVETWKDITFFPMVYCEIVEQAGEELIR